MKQEYYWYGDKLYILRKILINKVQYAICEDGDENLSIHRLSDLKKWEDTYQYQQQQEIKEATEKLKAEQETIKEKIKKEAIESLSTRIKLNVAFGDVGKFAPITLQIVSELEKIIKEKKIN